VLYDNHIVIKVTCKWKSSRAGFSLFFIRQRCLQIVNTHSAILWEKWSFTWTLFCYYHAVALIISWFPYIFFFFFLQLTKVYYFYFFLLLLLRLKSYCHFVRFIWYFCNFTFWSGCYVTLYSFTISLRATVSKEFKETICKNQRFIWDRCLRNTERRRLNAREENEIMHQPLQKYDQLRFLAPTRLCYS
jgi:hypothetical protein